MVKPGFCELPACWKSCSSQMLDTNHVGQKVTDGHVPVPGHHSQQVTLGDHAGSTKVHVDREVIFQASEQLISRLGATAKDLLRSTGERRQRNKSVGVWSRDLSLVNAIMIPHQ